LPHFSCFFFTIAIAPISADAGTDSKEKTTTLKGKVYLGDKDHPVAVAVIVLLDQKKPDKKDNSVDVKTDSQGDFIFEKVIEGKYTVSIRAWYSSKEEVPCKLLLAKTKDKNSTLVVVRDKDRFVEQIFIEGFSVKAGKETVKDFDIECKGMFGN
jgi:hypothetical protein